MIINNKEIYLLMIDLWIFRNKALKGCGGSDGNDGSGSDNNGDGNGGNDGGSGYTSW